MKPVINSVELTIDYKVGNDIISLRGNTFEDSGLTFSIFDKDMDKYTGATSIEFENMKELKCILDDFTNKCNQLKIKI